MYLCGWCLLTKHPNFGREEGDDGVHYRIVKALAGNGNTSLKFHGGRMEKCIGLALSVLLSTYMPKLQLHF